MIGSDNKNCNCGHAKQDHILQVGSVTKLAFLGDGFFRTPQIGKGLCKKCMCPKYKPLVFFNSKLKEYPAREKLLDVLENRCGICGRLVENHENVGHVFKK